MRLPRKGILIRIVIYGAALSYFGWQALSHYFDERAAEESAASASDDVTKRQYQLPDGRSVEVLELTPEQAERMYGVPPSVGPDDGAKGAGAEAPAKEGAEPAPAGGPAADEAEAPAEPAEAPAEPAAAPADAPEG